MSAAFSLDLTQLMLISTNYISVKTCFFLEKEIKMLSNISFLASNPNNIQLMYQYFIRHYSREHKNIKGHQCLISI